MNFIKYIFMYNFFDSEDEIYDYVIGFFGSDVIIRPNTYYGGQVHSGSSLWVRDDVYNYVFATINAHTVYSNGEFEVMTANDCEKWKQDQIDNGLVIEK